ncbi:HlyD family secretion protein [Tranquillimonas rosea]|uniref:Membrane fusion protein (MFP) family protein n=1 Tax=Tranquillimonas rosea TaxID=641238 RepID=A0A1H9WZH4_9RHOB|nr:HlyD family type I secretion periplasmic adaptor subunit [Tranquillimonas rosea]SES39239.1 HlyD family secretion protein [Tranquillimonas rosea]
MRYEQIDRSIGSSLVRQLGLALAMVALLVGGAGSVAALAEVSGAVVGAGKIIVEGRPKHVQHLDGGTVSEILVREGEEVEAGETLFRLDPTVVEANLGIVTGQIESLLAQTARLEAELAGTGRIRFPEALADTADTAMLRAGQEELMAARASARQGRHAQLSAQIDQLGEKVTALEAQGDATRRNLALAEAEVADAVHLSDRGLLRSSDLRAAQRMQAELAAQVAGLEAQIVETRDQILGRELERARIDETFREEVLTVLDEKRGELARRREERIAAQDRQRRLEIRAPISGYVHELDVNTLGQVLTAGETLVTIVPGDDRLIVETRLSPQDVDQVYPGQTARLRFTGLDQRTTPQLTGTVLDVSPDSTTDEQTGTTYYLARLRIAPDELARLGDAELRPGMPVEVFIETRMRTILSYLIKPVTDQIQHAMRES